MWLTGITGTPNFSPTFSKSLNSHSYLCQFYANIDAVLLARAYSYCNGLQPLISFSQLVLVYHRLHCNGQIHLVFLFCYLGCDAIQITPYFPLRYLLISLYLTKGSN